MELATIDPHSHKVHTKLYKIPKVGVNRSSSKQDTDVRPSDLDAVRQCPDGHIFLC